MSFSLKISKILFRIEIVLLCSVTIFLLFVSRNPEMSFVKGVFYLLLITLLVCNITMISFAEYAMKRFEEKNETNKIDL